MVFVESEVVTLVALLLLLTNPLVTTNGTLAMTTIVIFNRTFSKLARVTIAKLTAPFSVKVKNGTSARIVPSKNLCNLGLRPFRVKFIRNGNIVLMKIRGLNEVTFVAFRTTTATSGLDLNDTNINVLVLLPALHRRTTEVQSLLPATLTVVISVSAESLVKNLILILRLGTTCEVTVVIIYVMVTPAIISALDPCNIAFAVSNPTDVFT